MADRQTQYRVQGMKCGGCEAAAKDAVSKLSGYVDARFDHKTESGVVTGDVDPQVVVRALAAVGYTATLASS
jgi:copper chaperone CopZ